MLRQDRFSEAKEVLSAHCVCSEKKGRMGVFSLALELLVLRFMKACLGERTNRFPLGPPTLEIQALVVLSGDLDKSIQ